MVHYLDKIPTFLLQSQFSLLFEGTALQSKPPKCGAVASGATRGADRRHEPRPPLRETIICGDGPYVVTCPTVVGKIHRCLKTMEFREVFPLFDYLYV